ncbi:magnesium-protoporphyrin O-methyltransferase [Kribbella amoyensis]|uniref:Magnesium-protoporphyrin O-methyltransferase n=1 Tax=Kribbella amoyensis TaxID=996641 RepID=A0A561C0W5_9ACTN|nr:SAM-dependent methyltransferase [Kribbella amoyensis]TWD84811.1 magnesium-protoporphyrin O-methyltransferase [Kribbella amoyensis]
MDDCCDPRGYRATFGAGFARRVAGRYRKRGLTRTQRRLVSFLEQREVRGATVLEIGGGVGELQVELLRRGADRATNLELSTGYEDEAAELLEQSGLTGRVARRFVDIATVPDEVEPADIVVLHRVVCCYPDYQKLLTAAGGHARRLLVFSHPPRNPLITGGLWCDSLLRRLRGNSFRAFAHPPDAMIEVLRAQGLTVSYRHRGLAWTVVGLER